MVNATNRCIHTLLIFYNIFYLFHIRCTLYSMYFLSLGVVGVSSTWNPGIIESRDTKYIINETSNKYYKTSTIECIEQKSIIIGCNIWMIWRSHFSDLYGRYVLRYDSFFKFSPIIDATDRSKILVDITIEFFFDVSLYTLSFFANTPFKWTIFKLLLKKTAVWRVLHYLKYF